MALMNCPECNDQVSNIAITCPHCGHPLTNRSPNAGVLKEISDTIHRISKATEDRTVKITNIDLPFMSMVVLMVKWAIAAIPAMIILMILGSISSGFIIALVRPFLR